MGASVSRGMAARHLSDPPSVTDRPSALASWHVYAERVSRWFGRSVGLQLQGPSVRAEGELARFGGTRRNPPLAVGRCCSLSEPRTPSVGRRASAALKLISTGKRSLNAKGGREGMAAMWPSTRCPPASDAISTSLPSCLPHSPSIPRASFHVPSQRHSGTHRLQSNDHLPTLSVCALLGRERERVREWRETSQGRGMPWRGRGSPSLPRPLSLAMVR